MQRCCVKSIIILGIPLCYDYCVEWVSTVGIYCHYYRRIANRFSQPQDLDIKIAPIVLIGAIEFIRVFLCTRADRLFLLLPLFLPRQSFVYHHPILYDEFCNVNRESVVANPLLFCCFFVCYLERFIRSADGVTRNYDIHDCTPFSIFNFFV